MYRTPDAVITPVAAHGSATATGKTLFAKNSDRERNEAQFLELRPARRHAPGTRVAATYRSIPQVRQTHAVLLSRPFWIWGAEMGANEHGVVIGNEALHSHIPAQRRRALIGMDGLYLLGFGPRAPEAVRELMAALYPNLTLPPLPPLADRQ